MRQKAWRLRAGFHGEVGGWENSRGLLQRLQPPDPGALLAKGGAAARLVEVVERGVAAGEIVLVTERGAAAAGPARRGGRSRRRRIGGAAVGGCARCREQRLHSSRSWSGREKRPPERREEWPGQIGGGERGRRREHRSRNQSQRSPEADSDFTAWGEEARGGSQVGSAAYEDLRLIYSREATEKPFQTGLERGLDFHLSSHKHGGLHDLNHGFESSRAPSQKISWSRKISIFSICYYLSCAFF